MRVLFALVAVALVLVLGAVQLASSAAYGDLASRPSFPALLHGIDPSFLRAFIGGPRARAAAAIHNGDLTTARALLATLPSDAQTADLRGQLAERRGERDVAIDEYVRAGDLERAQALIDELATRDAPRALSDQERLVERLSGDPNAAEVTGQAWWRLGELQAQVGYQRPAQRSALWRAAEISYERALASAPNEETYLLAAGYQSLANGDARAAERWYTRAAQVVPNSADAYRGLAWTAAVRRDCAAATSAATRARALDRTAVARDVAADPLFGPALRACGVAPA